MKSKAYWENRAGERMVRYMDDAEETAREIGSAYLGASKYIEKEAKDIFKGFQAAFEPSESEARSILSTKYSDTALNELKKAIANMSNDEERQKALAAISSPAYQYRINKLNALNGNIAATCDEMYKTELKSTMNCLTKAVNSAYLNTVYDIQKGYNVGGSFDVIPQSRIDQILKTPWCGAHFSTRVWNNTQQTADELKRELLVGFLTGKSEDEMTDAIRTRFKVSKDKARRLVRTEANYVTNQAEKESLVTCGCEEYEFVAVLDSKTSKLCRKKDGKRFKISQAVAGVDLPPLHAWCRSTIIGVFPSDEDMEQLFSEDSEEFGLDEPFDEWVKHLEEKDGKWVYNSSKTPDFETKSEKNEDNSQKTLDFIKSNAPEVLDNTAESGIIKTNKAKALDLFDDYDVSDNYPITAEGIFEELSTTKIGKETLRDIENLPQRIKLTDGVAPPDLRGENQGSEIIIYLKNCQNTIWAARTVIHEITHYKYGIGKNQWSECVCIVQELKHSRNTEKIAISDFRKVISAVKADSDYKKLNWRKGGTIRARITSVRTIK